MAATTLLSDNGVTSGITGYTLTGGNDGTLQLQTTTAGGTATTAMTIDASQNVGIGVSNPSAYSSRFVSKGTTSGLFTDDTNYTFTIKSGGSGVSLVGGEAGNSLALQAGGAEKLRIDTSGNVGIGTDSPSTFGKLAVTGGMVSISGTPGENPLIRGSFTNGSYPAGVYTYNSFGSNLANWLTFKVTNAAGTTSEAARIDASGNVGIGVTTPTSTGLSLYSSKNLSWQYNGTANYANIFNQDNSASLILASGYQYIATSGGFASSYAGSWAKSAISVGYGGIYLYADTATTVAIGTNVTPSVKLRILSTGDFTKYDADSSTYVRDFGVYAASNTYLHIKFNARYDSNKMIGWRLYGFQAYSTFIDTYYGCYLYGATPAAPYGSIVRDAGNASGGAMYYSADGYLCISCQINANGYTGLRLESLVNGGSYGNYIDVAVLAYKGYATATGAY